MKNKNIIKLVIIILIVIVVGVIFIYKNAIRSEIQKNEAEKNNVESEVDISSNEKALPTLLDFGATTCESCKIMASILDKIEIKYQNKLTVQFINVYSASRDTQKYNIRTIPTIIFLNSEGKEVYRQEGVMYEDEITNKLLEMGVE